MYTTFDGSNGSFSLLNAITPALVLKVHCCQWYLQCNCKFRILAPIHVPYVNLRSANLLENPWFLLSAYPETAAVLRRTVEALLENGAVVRNLENLGERTLPYKISKHNLRHTRGGYYLVDFEASPTILPTMLDHLYRDIDVIRPTILKKQPPKSEENCPGLIPPNNDAKLHSKRK
ncbi:28S ribosomal protein S6, mitochondrial isoform X1 [Hypanus sabinus]|uniref:28S ribosomal protein S6, mitochondrial isoform X1 n=1 Tax=Hypanus sabinus TaxID=79690 RepID=UPI0028C417EF|nr:28S ribosomal protein S6, mitochondrial isoform X1 [Hypanus sabinus]